MVPFLPVFPMRGNRHLKETVSDSTRPSPGCRTCIEEFSTGAKLVFPGPHLHPDDLLDLMTLEPPTLALGVPTG